MSVDDGCVGMKSSNGFANDEREVILQFYNIYGSKGFNFCFEYHCMLSYYLTA
jgi:hypothetical protein